ncbi:MAG: hypothetical protein IPF68_01880 [Bacteroidales bacterium]|nr:hypothetical protein [Bacteroidales bacterium]
MKSKFTSFFLAIAVASFLFSGCDKEDETPDNNNNNSVNTFSYDDAFGILVAVKSVSYTTVGGFEIPVEVNSGSAFFPTDAGAETFTDAGTVSLEGKNLKKQSNNIYVYEDYLNPLTLSDITWNVTGNGSIPAFNKSVSRPLPTFSGYSALPGNISKAAGVSISLGSAVYAADSVIVMITSSNDAVLKSVAGGTGSVTFSSSELSKLAASNAGSISVSPYNLTTETISGKKYYFVNESSYLKMLVNITE